MPPAGQKPSDDTFTNIVAYILRQTGMDAGDTPLVPTTHGAIGTAVPARSPQRPAGTRPVREPRDGRRQVDVAFLTIGH